MSPRPRVTRKKALFAIRTSEAKPRTCIVCNRLFLSTWPGDRCCSSECRDKLAQACRSTGCPRARVRGLGPTEIDALYEEQWDELPDLDDLWPLVEEPADN